MGGPTTVDEEEYYILEIDIESEEDEDEGGPTFGAALRSDSGSSFHLLFSLQLTTGLTCLGTSLLPKGTKELPRRYQGDANHYYYVTNSGEKLLMRHKS